MAETEFGLNHALARQAWANDLAIESLRAQYWARFMSEGDDGIIKIRTELSKQQKGEKITIGVRMQLTGDGQEGDNRIEGTSYEEALDYYYDYVYIDQRRKSVYPSQGKMDDQRVPYNLRKEGKDALVTWHAEDQDQLQFMYLSGARGVAASALNGGYWHFPENWSTRANNALQTPNSENIVYGGNATGSADMDSSDTFTLSLLDRLRTKVDTMNPYMRPAMVDGKRKHVVLIHPYQAYSIRTSTSDGDWKWIQANAGNRGDENRLYSGALGEYNGFILHEHHNVIIFNTYGSGANVEAARALVLGLSAGIVAWGGKSSMGRYDWNEETEDRGNKLVITAGCIHGEKKTRINSKDWGVIAVDTAAADPN